MDNIELNIRNLICTEALKHLGKPAKKFNMDFDCFDCAQLIYVVYKDIFNIDMNKDGYGMSATTRQFTSTIGNIYVIDYYTLNDKMKIIKDHVLPGDILFFHTQSLDELEPTLLNRYPGHVALYLGDYKYIHAKVKKGLVEIDSLQDSIKMQNKLVAYKSIVDDNFIKVYQKKYRK